MKLSTPIFQLKRRAKLMVRNNTIPLHEALDQIAREEGFARWSLLSAHLAASSLSKDLFSRIVDGDMLLLAGRPGQGKTALGFELLCAATEDGRRSVLFTLEMTEQQARKRIKKNAAGHTETEIVTSDEICADYITRHLSSATRGTFSVIDYLQILDQQRHKPDLSQQVSVLGEFAQKTGVIFAFISQIDRSFDQENKRLPDMRDIRLPNLLDLGLFTKACFLHNGEAQLQNVN
ncbi:DNA helicase [Agrobacterium sp. B1(2019)]|uniref:DNA helicase n=1 Tax=Agrobacterium sp. B1(2019) TaxID=2607032 RepID=UPI0011EFD3EA|nr:DNA helicase [Agrobacterium sp. B1(2019)]TZG33252.1 DNA helicase [Agrobacterium sp. B1(2019)]